MNEKKLLNFYNTLVYNFKSVKKYINYFKNMFYWRDLIQI